MKLSTTNINRLVAIVPILCGLPTLRADSCDEVRTYKHPFSASSSEFTPVPWTGGIVRFDFAQGVSDERRLYVLRAMDMWMDMTGAKIRFVRDTAPSVAPNWKLIITNDLTSNNHSTHVGMPTTPASPNSPPPYDSTMNVTNFGVDFAVHELGHVLGWHHEQGRPDRGTYIDIICTNFIDDDGRAQSKIVSEGSWMSGTRAAYDYKSIMHYGPCLGQSCAACHPNLECNTSCPGECGNFGGWIIWVYDIIGRYQIGRWDIHWISEIDAEEARAVYGAHPAGWGLPAQYVGHIVPGNTVSQVGTIGNPFETIAAGYNATPTGSEMFIAGNHTVGTITMNRAMTLKCNGGMAKISSQ